MAVPSDNHVFNVKVNGQWYGVTLQAMQAGQPGAFAKGELSAEQAAKLTEIMKDLFYQLAPRAPIQKLTFDLTNTSPVPPNQPEYHALHLRVEYGTQANDFNFPTEEATPAAISRQQVAEKAAKVFGSIFHEHDSRETAPEGDLEVTVEPIDELPASVLPDDSDGIDIDDEKAAPNPPPEAKRGLMGTLGAGLRAGWNFVRGPRRPDAPPTRAAASSKPKTSAGVGLPLRPAGSTGPQRLIPADITHNKDKPVAKLGCVLEVILQTNRAWFERFCRAIQAQFQKPSSPDRRRGNYAAQVLTWLRLEPKDEGSLRELIPAFGRVLGCHTNLHENIPGIFERLQESYNDIARTVPTLLSPDFPFNLDDSDRYRSDVSDDVAVFFENPTTKNLSIAFKDQDDKWWVDDSSGVQPITAEKINSLKQGEDTSKKPFFFLRNLGPTVA